MEYLINNNNENEETTGGYSLQNILKQHANDKNTQYGGNSNFNQFENMVIPLGLVLDNRTHSITQKYMEVFDDNYEHKYVETAFFDKLLYSINDLIVSKNKSKKYKSSINSNRKTKKNN